MHWLLIGVSTLVMGLASWWWFRRSSGGDQYRKTPTWWPIVGNVPDIIRFQGDYAKLLDYWSHIMPGLAAFKITLFGEEAIIVQDWTLVKEILYNKSFDRGRKADAKRSPDPTSIEALFGDAIGMIPQKGSDWKKRRSAFQNIIAGNKIRDKMSQVAKIVHEECQHCCEISKSGRGEPVFCASDLTDVIAMRSLFGIFMDIHNVSDLIPHYNEIIRKYFQYQINYNLRTMPGLGPLFRLILSDKLEPKREIARKVKRILETLEPDNPIFSLQGSADLELFSHRLFAWGFGGYDTTSASMQWLLLHLYQHPEIRQHLATLVEEYYDPEDPTKILNIPLDKELMYFMKESARLRPATNFIPRQVMDDVEVEGWRFKQGDQVWISAPAVHRNKDVWGEDVEEFNMDRWKDDVDKDIFKARRASYMAFSGGARRCPGEPVANMELKVFMCVILSSYDFEILNAETVEGGRGLTNHPYPYLDLRMTCRSS
jgi:cytochrome P450